MYDIKIRNQKGKYFVADDEGNIIIKGLSEKQAIQVYEYQKKFLSSNKTTTT